MKKASNYRLIQEVNKSGYPGKTMVYLISILLTLFFCGGAWLIGNINYRCIAFTLINFFLAVAAVNGHYVIEEMKKRWAL